MFAVVFTSLLRAEDKAPAPAPTKAHVTVITEEANHQPLAGVMLRGVEVETRGPVDPFQPAFEATTDDSGRWTGDVPFGNYIVLATRGTMVAARSEGDTQILWHLRANKPQREIHLTLREGGDLNVLVTDAASGAPIANAGVALDDGHATLTDDHGNARFRAVALEEHELVAFQAPCADQRANFNNQSQPYTEVKVALSPGFQVHGQVRDAAGKPIANAAVQDYYSGPYIVVERHHCVTDAEGRYTLGWYPFTASLGFFGAKHKDFAPQTKQDLAAPSIGNSTTWDFVLDQGYSVTGVVKNEQGQPIQGASLRYGASASSATPRGAQTDAEGRFQITRIATDRPEGVLAQASGYAPLFLNVTPGKDDQVPNLEFTLTKGLTVTGQVVNREGAPVPEVSVAPLWKIESSTQFVGNGAISDKDGNFQLTDLPQAGNYVNLYGEKIAWASDVSIDPHQPLRLVVDKPCVIIGKVLDDETGLPISAFNVKLGTPKAPRQKDEPFGSYSAHLSRRGQDSRAKDGSFVIVDLIARAGYAMRVSAEGYVTAYEDKVMARPADDSDWPQVFRLKRGHVVVGIVTDDKTGKPIPNAMLLLHPDAHRPEGMTVRMLEDWHTYGVFDDGFERRTDANGHFQFSLAELEHPFFAFVRAPGYAPIICSQQARILPASWNLSLSAGATLRVDIHEYLDDGQKNLGVTVIAGRTVYDQIPLQLDGSFTIRDLPEGKVAVHLIRDQRVFTSSFVKDAMVKAGETTEIRFQDFHHHQLHCEVTLDGKPLAALIEVRATSDFRGQPLTVQPKNMAEAKTDDQGIVLFKMLPLDDRVHVLVTDPDHRKLPYAGSPQKQLVDFQKQNEATVKFEFTSKP